MLTGERLERLVALVEERGFVSVKELSQLLDVSEVTIRRDLQQLDEEKRLQRTYGGAASLRLATPPGQETSHEPATSPLEGLLTDRVDVLIATSVDPAADRVLLGRAEKMNTPVIAESLALGGQETVICVDNYHAALALGHWAGHYVQEHFDGRAAVLNLTFHLSNTQARSQGFMDGITEVLPSVHIVLSISSQSRYQSAYQVTTDALTVNPNINVIFAINDITAWGALQACRDLRHDPDSLLIVTFGLEGDRLKEALMAGTYCRAGLAMFPEIVAPVCVEAAIDAYNHRPLARQLTTPHVVLTAETLPEYYTHTPQGWQINWETVHQRLTIPLDIDKQRSRPDVKLPKRIGFVIPFTEHEWYKNLTSAIQAHASRLNIEVEIVNAEQHLKDEIDWRSRKIAELAAQQARPGDVIFIDGGPLGIYLAEAVADTDNLTVITHSIPVFDVLRSRPNITLISTGGVWRRSSEALVGPTAEASLREMRADKLFLVVTGITLEFGLSHTTLAEVTMKQAMIRAAREIILLADHTKFGEESVMQVAPAQVVDKLITDDGLAAATRLELTQLGIEVIIAKT